MEGRGKVPNLCAISSFSFASFVIFLHCLASKLDASAPPNATNRQPNSTGKKTKDAGSADLISDAS